MLSGYNTVSFARPWRPITHSTAARRRWPVEEDAMSDSIGSNRLRRAAEARLTENRESGGAVSDEADLPRLVHELQVHQIELEMQKEELLRAKEALEAERTNYFDLYNQAPVGYLTLDEQGFIKQANLTVATLLGIDRSALIEQPLSSLIFKEDAARYAQYERQLIESGKSRKHLTCELRIMKRYGSPFWANLAASAVQSDHVAADGAAVFSIVLTDISERKQAEEALRERNEFFHLIAQNVADFIAVLDRDGRRLYNSPSYLQFFGGVKELKGSDSLADVHPDDRERVTRIFRETVQTGLGHEIVYRLLIADGRVRDMESHGSVVKDSQGQVVRVVVVSHDITERKQLEDQVRQLAFHDALTKLPNRRLLYDRLSQSMAASARSGSHGAVMFLDMDNFKRLNDSHGHAVGDLLLIEVAERLKGCVREMDTVARFGGDEFVVMISELETDKEESIQEARGIAEKILSALSEPYQLIIRTAGKAELTVEHRCSVSIGVMLFIDHVASQGDILKWADRAMYQAKAAGRNAIRFFDSDS